MRYINCLSLFAAVLAGILSSSCARDAGEVMAEARKYLAEGKRQLAIETLYDNLDDSQLADSAINIIMPALSESVTARFFLFNNMEQMSVEVSPEHQMYSAVISDDGKHLVTSEGETQRVCVYSFPDMKLERVIDVPDYVFTARMDRDGKKVAAAAHNGNVYLYDFPSGELDTALHTNDYSVRDIYFSKDGCLFTVSNDHSLSRFDYLSGEKLDKLTLHSRNVKDLSFSPDETMLCTASNDGSVQVLCYDGENLDVNGRYISIGNNYANATAISPDKSFLVTGSGFGDLQFWNTSDHSFRSEINLDDPVLSVAVSPDGSKVAAGTSTHVYIIDAATCGKLYTIPVFGSDFWSVQFVGNSKLMFADRGSVYQIQLPGTADVVAAGRAAYDQYKKEQTN